MYPLPLKDYFLLVVKDKYIYIFSSLSTELWDWKCCCLFLVKMEGKDETEHFSPYRADGKLVSLLR